MKIPRADKFHKQYENTLNDHLGILKDCKAILRIEEGCKSCPTDKLNRFALRKKASSAKQNTENKKYPSYILVVKKNRMAHISADDKVSVNPVRMTEQHSLHKLRIASTIAQWAESWIFPKIESHVKVCILSYRN